MSDHRKEAEVLRSRLYAVFTTSASTADIAEALLEMLQRSIEDAYNQGRVDERKAHE